MQRRTGALQGFGANSIMPVMKLSNTRPKWRNGYGSGGFSQSGAKAHVRACDHPGCKHEGEFRAPQARDRLNDYYWFCLDHVRAYNSGWNYYAGMSPDEIESHIRQDTTWQRPTWPLGGGRPVAPGRIDGLYDPFGVMGEGAEGSDIRTPKRPAKERAAMTKLGLQEPLTLPDLKARYKELVKRHHPDANGGDPESEEKFKQINQAYTVLLTALDAGPRL